VPVADPTAAFAAVALDIHIVARDEVFHRIWLGAYPDPLGFGKTRSRFSDPRRRMPDARFGVLYLGSSIHVCFLEALLRDARDGAVGDFPLDERELDRRRFAPIEVTTPLRLLDLRDNGPVRMGIPSDVVRGSRQTPARRWSVAIHEHPAAVDGIIYPSRLNNEINLAVYDRAIWKLGAGPSLPLRDAPDLPRLLDEFYVALV